MLETSPEPLSCSQEKLARFSRERPQDAAANYYYALALSKSAAESISTPLMEQVQALLEKSIRIDPNFAEAYLELGILHAARGEDRQAEGAYEHATRANPDLAEAHFRLAQIYKKAGDSSKARQQFDAYEQIQKREAAALESKRRQIQQFVVIFKDPGQNRRQTSVTDRP
jgi:Tfp pilus assembly protein PilF